MKKTFLLIGIIVIVLIGTVFWYWNRNPYSKETLRLEIISSPETSAFREVEYIVKFKNNGNITLESPRLTFEFPENTLLESGFQIRQDVGADEIGDIYPGEEKSFVFKGRVFGQEGDVKIAKTWLSYQPKGLKARYESATTFSTEIKSIPLTFDFDISSKVENAKDFNFLINYFSSLDYPLSDLGIKIDYPDGFEFIKSSPRPKEKNSWDIPILNKAEGGRIEIIGKFSGQVGSQKIFKAILGVWVNDVFIPLKEVVRGVEITDPRLSIFQQINSQNEYVASAGDSLHYEIFFRNIGKDPFTDLFLVVKLSGNGFDFDTIKTQGGQFKKGDNSITWDWRSNQKLKFLDQGEEGRVEFWISLKNDWQIGGVQEKNSIIKDSVMISQAKEEFETRINSKVAIEQKAYYQDEIFGNSGPFPLRSGEETTYTVIWQVKNYFNDLKGMKVKAMLPPYVRLTGKVFPEEEISKFSFDSQSREIVWMVNADNQDIIGAGTGILNPPPNVSFQIAVRAPSGQDLNSLEIIKEAIVSGEDQWTELNVEGRADAIKASLSNP